MEAMANGAAVVCSPGGAMAEIGGDAVIYADAAGLAAAIRTLGTDPRRLATLGEAARQRAAQYDLVKIGRLVDALRARIIAEWSSAQ
jgi:UDP-glucose:(glucosyl)LPS alpha-1,2-glucosyltransferase